jgi:hypothetical protein
MKTPKRSETLARALASESPGLPEDFAARVAAQAEARERARASIWNSAGMIGAFAGMLAVCMFGWFQFGAPQMGGAEWLSPLLRALALQPWLVVGISGVAIVRTLTFTRRTLT